MPRSIQPVEFNSFIGGLVTEASPLTFPPNASLDEENFVLNKNGSRTRRKGLAFEEDYVEVDSNQALPDDGQLVSSFYKWSNVGGDAKKTFIVAQVQNRIHFFDASIQPVSNSLVGIWDYDDSQTIVRFSFASVDGKLVVVTGRKDVDVFSYEDSTKFTILSKRLLIRDFFGVTDIAA